MSISADDFSLNPEELELVARTIEQSARATFETEKAKQPTELNKKLTEKLNELFLYQKQTEQDFRWQIVLFRKRLLLYLLYSMTVETILLYTIIILASLPSKILMIERVTLQILVGATIAQISGMLIVVIKSVYADSLNTFIMSNNDK
jgi:hypothetical protein